MMRMLASIAIMVVLSLCALSCRQPPDMLYQTTVSRAQMLAEKGETQQAVAELRELFDNKRFSGFQPNLLDLMMHFELGAGDVTGAQRLFHEVAGRDVNLAGTVVGAIEGYLSSQGRHDELIAWCVALQAYHFNGAISVNLAGFHFKALEVSGKGAEIPAALALYLIRLEESSALGLAQAQFAAMLGRGQRNEAGQILSMVEKTIKDSPMRRGVLLGMNVDLSLAAQDRMAADAILRKNLEHVPDDSAIRNLTEVANAHANAGDFDAPDALARFFIETAKTRQGLRESAAALWVKLAERRGSTSELVKRLVALKEFGLSTSFILDQTDSVYSMLLDRGKKEDFEPLYKLYETMYAAMNDDVTQRRLVGVLLDVGFYLQKFEEALTLVETGMKTADPAQKAMLVSKIKAHIALQKGQTLEAIANFRDFMAQVAKGTGPELDPIDNSRVTKEMILGLNARRIGDILAGAGAQAEAAKAYAEARDYYTKALAEFPDLKSIENQKIRKQLSEIPLK